MVSAYKFQLSVQYDIKEASMAATANISYIFQLSCTEVYFFISKFWHNYKYDWYIILKIICPKMYAPCEIIKSFYTVFWSECLRLCKQIIFHTSDEAHSPNNSLIHWGQGNNVLQTICLECIFVNENCCILSQMLLTCIPKNRIDNEFSVLVTACA